MFDPKEYKTACAQLTLGGEKLEELIAMTENTAKKPMSRPMKTVLIAAACIAALTVTAFAAPALQELFTTYVVTVNDGESHTVVAPVIQTYNENGRNYLVVDAETIDITEALEKDEFFVTHSKDGSEIRVDKDGMVSVSNDEINYSFNPTDGASAPDSIDVDGETLTGGEIGTYTVTADESGAISVTPAE